jgi:uncharacterized protein YndB with AHSA1/START domain
MARKKFTLEYIVRSSPAILFSFVTNPSNLAQWFSDYCDANDNFIEFGWSGSKEKAQIMEYIEDEYVKYHWLDGQPDEFFSFKIYKSDIANDTIMEITDFADEKEVKDQSQLWDSQIDELKHHLGAG